MKRRFVVLDRDGTIIAQRPYLSDPQQVELIPGAAAALRNLQKLGLGLALVTNQSGIGRNYFNETRLEQIHRRLGELLEAEGIVLDGIYSCPHLPDDNCACRKPRPGLVELAVKELNFDPREAFVVGDDACDVELGQQIGAATFLVRTGYGSRVAAEGRVTPDYMVNGVYQAARIIELLLSADLGRRQNAQRP